MVSKNNFISCILIFKYFNYIYVERVSYLKNQSILYKLLIENGSFDAITRVIIDRYICNYRKNISSGLRSLNTNKCIFISMDGLNLITCTLTELSDNIKKNLIGKKEKTYDLFILLYLYALKCINVLVDGSFDTLFYFNYTITKLYSLYINQKEESGYVYLSLSFIYNTIEMSISKFDKALKKRFYLEFNKSLVKHLVENIIKKSGS